MVDFNAKHPEWTSAPVNSAGNYLSDLFMDFCLTQCVSETTRYFHDVISSSTFDLLATNRPDIITGIHISDPVSDHCCVTAILKTSVPSANGTLTLISDYKKSACVV